MNLKKSFKLMAVALTATFISACASKTDQNAQDNATDDNTKTVVAFFSYSGNTKKVAEKIAKAADADLYEIQPEIAYTDADIDYKDDNSRSTKEMSDATSRPALKTDDTSFDNYEIVFLGYPIWWNEAPRIVNTFIEAKKLQGKTVIPFATSGSSQIENSETKLKETYPDINWQPGKLLNNVDDTEINSWVETIVKK